MTNKPRVLIAGTNLAIEICTRLLDGQAEVIGVESFDDALGHLSEELDLVICSVRFDDSRMFDFLEAFQRQRICTPVICCRTLDRPMNPEMHKVIELSTEALGSVGFFDLYRESALNGAEAAGARFRDLVRSALQTDSTSNA